MYAIRFKCRLLFDGGRPMLGTRSMSCLRPNTPGLWKDLACDSCPMPRVHSLWGCEPPPLRTCMGNAEGTSFPFSCPFPLPGAPSPSFLFGSFKHL